MEDELIQSPDEPETIQKALSSAASDKCKKTIEEEISKVNKVWILIDLPQGCNSIGKKWVLKQLRKVDSTIGSLPDCQGLHIVGRY